MIPNIGAKNVRPGNIMVKIHFAVFLFNIGPWVLFFLSNQVHPGKYFYQGGVFSGPKDILNTAILHYAGKVSKVHYIK